MSVIWYVLWYIVAVGFLVIVHEFGHFWVARRLGFKVLRFSIGFGTPLLRKEVGRDRTEIVLAPIPMGGYVKMLDEREGPVPPEDLPRSYMRRPPWQRILVLFAGPGSNILFAILVLWGMLWVNGTTSVRPVVSEVTASSPAASAGLASGDEITAIDGKPISDQKDVLFGLLDSVLSHGGTQLTVRAHDGANRTVTLVTDPAQRKRLAELSNLLGVLGFEMQGYVTPPVIGKVLPNGPAAHAGLRSGDRVLAVDDRQVRDFTDIPRYMPTIPGKMVTLRYSRDGVEHTTQIAVAKVEDGGTTYVGIGARALALPHFPPGLVVHRALSPPAALAAAANEAWDLTAVQGRLIWRMVLGQVSLKNLSGPIGIAQYAGESAEEGVASFLSFLVLISLAIALFNLLPIPILDGGQIVFQAAEWVKGSPLSERTQIFGQQIGIALLVLLLGVAIFNDVSRQFG